MFLEQPEPSPDVEDLYRRDRAGSGFLMNLTRLWAWRPDVLQAFTAARSRLLSTSSLTPREQAVIVCAAVGAIEDSYCSLAWGRRLARNSDGDTAAAVLLGSSGAALDPRELALATWARRVATDPNATSAVDVRALREAGLGEREIFEATALVAFRVAFSMINDALGAQPDREVLDAAPDAVRAAVTYGRAAA